MQKKILIIGGASYQDTTNPRIGGTTILMDNYIEYCESHNIPFVFVSSNKYCGRFKCARNIVSMIVGTLMNVRKCDIIMVNISSKSGFILLLPYMIVVAKIFGLQSVCRMFAGSIHKYIESKKIFKSFLLLCLKQTKVSFFETKELIRYFKNNDYEAEWFPNVRKPIGCHMNGKYLKRLVFISQIKEEKGIDQLLYLSNKLPEEYLVDFYGPILEPKYSESYFSNYRASYKGVLKSDDIINKLLNYDLLIFPTFWPNEGYPGIIIEAQSIGMPVISTFCGGIPELIENEVNGILIPMKDTEALVDAVLDITPEKYKFLSVNAERIFVNNFNSEIVNKRITDLMLE